MNKAQKIVLLAGLVMLLATIVFIPYKTTKYERESTTKYLTEKIESLSKDKKIKNEYIEFYTVFSTPVSIEKTGVKAEIAGATREQEYQYETTRKRDYTTQITLILIEIIIATILIFIFKWVKKKN